MTIIIAHMVYHTITSHYSIIVCRLDEETRVVETLARVTRSSDEEARAAIEHEYNMDKDKFLEWPPETWHVRVSDTGEYLDPGELTLLECLHASLEEL